MASTEELLEEVREIKKEVNAPDEQILEEVREVKKEVKAPSVARRALVGSLTGAVVGAMWVYRARLAGLGKRVVSRTP
jgi:uncharacterized membrane protein